MLLLFLLIYTLACNLTANTGAASTALTYDANGNTITDESGNTYTWDAHNHLTAIVYPGGTHTEFAYDGMGRRTQIVDLTGTTVGSGSVTGTRNQLWSGDGLTQERDASNAVTGQLFAQGEQQTVGGTASSYFYSMDHAGSITEMSDGSGNLVSRLSYSAYGKTTTVSGTNLPVRRFQGNLAQINPLIFIGPQIYNPNTGTVVANALGASSGGASPPNEPVVAPGWFLPPPGPPPEGPQPPPPAFAAAGDPSSWMSGNSASSPGDDPDANAAMNALAQQYRNAICEIAHAALSGVIQAEILVAGAGLSLFEPGEAAAAEEAEGAEGAAAAGGRCFAAGTKVSTPHGEVNIEDIKVGDTVYAHDFEAGKTVERKVIKTPRNFTYHWVKIQIGSETITATRGHRFWIENAKKWIEAADLKSGMTVRLQDGQIKIISSVVVIDLKYPERTYNLVVEEEHNYFVGNSQVLVHNGYPDATQQKLMSQLRAGQNVRVGSVEEARALLDHMSELRPAPGSGGPGTYAPPGSYRGDLINTGPTLEDYNSAPAHQGFEGPHYNIVNPDGTKPAIVIGC